MEDRVIDVSEYISNISENGEVNVKIEENQVTFSLKDVEKYQNLKCNCPSVNIDSFGAEDSGLEDGSDTDTAEESDDEDEEMFEDFWTETIHEVTDDSDSEDSTSQCSENSSITIEDYDSDGFGITTSTPISVRVSARRPPAQPSGPGAPQPQPPGPGAPQPPNPGPPPGHGGGQPPNPGGGQPPHPGGGQPPGHGNQPVPPPPPNDRDPDLFRGRDRNRRRRQQLIALLNWCWTNRDIRLEVILYASYC